MAKIASSYLPYLIFYWVELCFIFSYLLIYCESVNMSEWIAYGLILNVMKLNVCCIRLLYYKIRHIFFLSFPSPLCYSNNNIILFEYYDRFLSLFIYINAIEISSILLFFSYYFLLLSISMINSDFESKPYPSRKNGNIFRYYSLCRQSNRRIDACLNKCTSFGIVSRSGIRMQSI